MTLFLKSNKRGVLMKGFCKVVLVFMFLVLFSVVSLAVELDRSETLVITGAAWGPPSTWNILIPNRQMGTGGLVYETLFSYNPLNNEYRPWLAESGEWVSDNEYVVNLRRGIKWTDGEAFDADDLVFTYELARDNAVYYSPVWNWLGSVEAEDNYTVRFTFDEPHYAEWDKELYQRYIIPEHIWTKVPADKLIPRTNANPVGTGPYLYYTAGQDRMVWERNDNWWGNEVFGTPKPKYIVDLVNVSNNITLGMLMKGEIDLSNNFIPGVEKIKGVAGLKTWYEKEPYMLSWNTANLYMNTTRKPMDDSAFRRALAFAMNKHTIVDKVYGGLVKAANPTGLFGQGWLAYLDQGVVDEYGFYFDPSKAVALLDKAGYVDSDGDGWRDQPNGDPIELEVMVPSGWTDWMEAVKVVSNNAAAVGVNIQAVFPDTSLYDNNRFTRNFDLMIGNQQTTLTSTPFDYWNGVANDGIYGERIANGNWGAYDNPELFALIDEFNMTNDETEKMKIAAEIEKTLLVEMPTIPLWHNGLWAQYTNANWTNWPSEDNPYGVPVTWDNAYQLGMIDVLIGLEPVK
ncbi:ABC transporter substrate-binding protein [Halocella sp. SP3-1]|uniref:ABC transporter substrate-binding protein n=1 Tax=Halocella sp. SP3-1 TaxID=2382161 RepID=UPI000F7E61D9|nr:ABC transporter substrate-binding protein [Halocella sp. SP3-1]